jgi:energy-coupling factor transporter ATP-binding protein EcfA2
MAIEWLSKKIQTAWRLLPDALAGPAPASAAPAACASAHTRTVLFIGQTGAGKTTLLELFNNYERILRARENGELTNEALDKLTLISKEQERMANDPAEKARRDAAAKRMESMTDTTDVYAIKLGPLTLEIVDSPGFGDNRGLDQDKANVKTLIDFLKTRNSIHGICIVINGKETRSHSSLQLALTQLSSVVPVNALQNLFVLYTQCSSPYHRTFQPQVIAEKLQVDAKALEEGYSFCLDNPMGFLKNVRSMGVELKKRDRLALQSSVDICLVTMEDFIEFVGKLPPTPTKAFAELYDNQRNIEASLAAAFVNYEASMESERKKKKLRQRLAQHEMTAKQQEMLVEQAKIPQWTLSRSDTMNTLCLFVPKGGTQCHSNCHISCELSQLETGSPSFKKCKAFDNSPTCKECEHSSSSHFHTYQQWESATLLTPELLDGLQTALQSLAGRQEKLRQVEEDLAAMKSKIDDCQEALAQALTAFQQQATAPAWSYVLQNQITALETRLAAMEGLDAEDVPTVETELAKLRAQLQQVSRLERSPNLRIHKLGNRRRSVTKENDDEEDEKDNQKEAEAVPPLQGVPPASEPQNVAQADALEIKAPAEVLVAEGIRACACGEIMDVRQALQHDCKAGTSEIRVPVQAGTSEIRAPVQTAMFLPDIFVTSALEAVIKKNRPQLESDGEEEDDGWSDA